MIDEAGIPASNVDHSCRGAQRGSFEESKGNRGLTLKPTQLVRRLRGVHAIPVCLAIHDLPPCTLSGVGAIERVHPAVTAIGGVRCLAGGSGGGRVDGERTVRQPADAYPVLTIAHPHDARGRGHRGVARRLVEPTAFWKVAVARLVLGVLGVSRSCLTQYRGEHSGVRADPRSGLFRSSGRASWSASGSPAVRLLR